MARSTHNNTKKQTKEDYLKANNINAVDYKDVDLLRRFVSSNMKIVPRKRSGLSAKSQRKIANAIKQARIAGLLPFVGK